MFFFFFLISICTTFLRSRIIVINNKQDHLADDVFDDFDRDHDKAKEVQTIVCSVTQTFDGGHFSKYYPL